MTVLIVFIFTFGFFLFRGNRNTRSVAVNEIVVTDSNPDKQNNRRPLRVLQISDMHLENISVCPDQLFEHVKEYSIDLVALTGDFLDRKKSIPKLVPYLEVLKELNPSYGIYAVFGNHDYVLQGNDFADLKDLLNKYGVKTLQNENKVVDIEGTSVNIIGIDDFSTNRSDLSKSYEGLEEGYNLVFTHDPNLVLAMEGYRFDYLLSGHFHGGQIHWPKPYHLAAMGKLVKLNMIKGLHSYNDKPFYISEGLGQTGVNIRIGSRPEITVHHIHLPEAVGSESKKAG